MQISYISDIKNLNDFQILNTLKHSLLSLQTEKSLYITLSNDDTIILSVNPEYKLIVVWYTMFIKKKRML